MMTREQAINYLISTGMSEEQIKTVTDAFNSEHSKYQKIVEMLKSTGYKFGRMTPDEIYKDMEEATLGEIAAELYEFIDLLCDIWEMINNGE